MTKIFKIEFDFRYFFHLFRGTIREKVVKRISKFYVDEEYDRKPKFFFPPMFYDFQFKIFTRTKLFFDIVPTGIYLVITVITQNYFVRTPI